jgi:methionine-S-sulfoxide reductase
MKKGLFFILLTSIGISIMGQENNKYREAVFAAGCFWGVEARFMEMEGVIETEVGYTGGHQQNPSYKQVCSDMTGHAEAVRVVYDPQIVSYTELLKLFWQMHDPTQTDRQGPDIGSQYRSAIFYTDEKQKQLAEESKRQLQEPGKYKDAIATEIVPFGKFWAAEEYHQQYFKKRGHPSCH